MKSRFFRWGDVVPAVLLLGLAVWLIWMMFAGGAGSAVRVQTPTGEQRLPLSQDGTYTVVGRDGLSLTVTVQNGRVCVSHADCPDHVCMGTGWIARNGQSIACLPAQVLLCVESQVSEDGPDAVAR